MRVKLIGFGSDASHEKQFKMLEKRLSTIRNFTIKKKFFSFIFFSSFVSILSFSFYQLLFVIAFPEDSPYFRLVAKMSRLQSIPSLFVNPADDVSRGQKVVDFFDLFGNSDLWLFGNHHFIPVFDSGIILFYQNFGLFVTVLLFLAYVYLILSSIIRSPAASCILFCAIFHFTVASETLLIPRYCLLLSLLVFISLYLEFVQSRDLTFKI